MRDDLPARRAARERWHSRFCRRPTRDRDMRFLGAVRALLRGFEHGTCGRVNGLDSGIGRGERDMVRERLDLPFRRHRIAERA